MSATVSDKRIAKNTIFLYIRILISICLSLYTSRVVLEMLGIRDYGVYNIVGGLILVLSFLNLSMSGATQRFLNFEMGRGEEGRLAETFSASWVIHVSISLIVLILGETVGLWFVNNCLVIAPERMNAANWTYQFSLISGIFTILMVPFSGAVIAHEKMNIYALFSLLFSFLKLLVVLLLLYVPATDNLIVYAGLILGVTILNFLCYLFYGIVKFSECSLSFKADMPAIKSILKFSGSDIIGTSCFAFESQGVLFILNRVGGTVLNAAGGLANTVGLNINQFGTSLIMAFRPQIIQQYAAKNYANMQRLMINCSKYAIILLAIFAIPVFVEINFVLGIWLKEVPEHTALFCRLILLSAMSQMAVVTLNCGIHATGKMFSFSAITGFTYIIELPIMYWLIQITDNPNWVYIIPVFQLTFLVWLVARMLFNRMSEFKMYRYILKGFISPTVIILFIGTIVLFVSLNLQSGWLRFVISGCLSTGLIGIAAWYVLFDSEMRKEVVVYIKTKLHR